MSYAVTILSRHGRGRVAVDIPVDLVADRQRRDLLVLEEKKEVSNMAVETVDEKF